MISNENKLRESFALRKKRPAKERFGTLHCLVSLIFVITTLLLIFTRWDSLRINALHRAHYRPVHAINDGTSSEEFWLHGYLKWHTANRKRSSRLLVFNPTKAELGANIQGMLRVYAFAVLTNRLFLVNWTNAGPFIHVIDKKTEARFGYSVSNGALKPIGVQEVVYFHYHQFQDNKMYSTLKSDMRTISVATGHPALTNHLIGHLRSERWRGLQIPFLTLPVQQKLARILLAPSEAVVTMQRKLKEQFQLCAPHKTYSCVDFHQFPGSATPRQYIGIYARLAGGSAKSRDVRFSKFVGKEAVVARCFALHVKDIAKTIGEQSAKVFVSSESYSFRKDFGKYLREILARSEVVALGRSTKHYADFHSHSDKVRDQNVKLYAEMMLLGNAAHIVAFQSAFSEAAFLMGDALSYTVITPKSCGIFPTTQNRKKHTA